jgi:hypothetical protein
LERVGELEFVGGVPYVSQLMDGVPRITNIEHYMNIVKNKALLCGLIRTTNDLQLQAFEGKGDADAILAQAIERITALKSHDQKTAILTYTAKELFALTNTPIEYVVYPFAARGMIALVDGAAKAAGKTTLILTGVSASLNEKLFLDHVTKRVPVLLVTEENPRTLRLALERAGLTGETNLNIIPFTTVSALRWPQLVQYIERKCIDLEIGWLIIDTFYAVAGLGGEEENKAGVVDEAVAPLRRIAGRLDIPVTLTRHERKSGGEVGTSGRGSSALTGAADIVLLLKRQSGNQKAERRRLDVTGRIEQARHTIELRDGEYFIADERMESSASEAERLTQSILVNPQSSIRQLHKETGIGRNRIEKVASKAGWTYGESGWSRGGS